MHLTPPASGRLLPAHPNIVERYSWNDLPLTRALDRGGLPECTELSANFSSRGARPSASSGLSHRQCAEEIPDGAKEGGDHGVEKQRESLRQQSQLPMERPLRQQSHEDLETQEDNGEPESRAFFAIRPRHAGFHVDSTPNSRDRNAVGGAGLGGTREVRLGGWHNQTCEDGAMHQRPRFLVANRRAATTPDVSTLSSLGRVPQETQHIQGTRQLVEQLMPLAPVDVAQNRGIQDKPS